MQNIDILLWAIGGGFAGTWGLLFYLINRMGKLEDRVMKLELDMTEVKTILRMKECCMIKDDRKLPKAE